jgi:hypothetical protein
MLLQKQIESNQFNFFKLNKKNNPKRKLKLFGLGVIFISICGYSAYLLNTHIHDREGEVFMTIFHETHKYAPQNENADDEDRVEKIKQQYIIYFQDTINKTYQNNINKTNISKIEENKIEQQFNLILTTNLKIDDLEKMLNLTTQYPFTHKQSLLVATEILNFTSKRAWYYLNSQDTMLKERSYFDFSRLKDDKVYHAESKNELMFEYGDLWIRSYYLLLGKQLSKKQLHDIFNDEFEKISKNEPAILYNLFITSDYDYFPITKLTPLKDN